MSRIEVPAVGKACDAKLYSYSRLKKAGSLMEAGKKKSHRKNSHRKRSQIKSHRKKYEKTPQSAL